MLMKTKLIAVLASAAMLQANAGAAVDTFIRFHYATPINGIAISGLGYAPSESQDPLARFGFMELKDFSFGAENPVSIGSSTSGAAVGKTKFNDFSITRSVDAASPSLFKVLAAGAHFDYVDVILRKSGGGGKASTDPYLVYRFKSVYVSKVNWTSSDESPKESVTMGFGGMILQYRSQKPDGSLNTKVVASWSVIDGKAMDDELIDLSH